MPNNHILSADTTRLAVRLRTWRAERGGFNEREPDSPNVACTECASHGG